MHGCAAAPACSCAAAVLRCCSDSRRCLLPSPWRSPHLPLSGCPFHSLCEQDAFYRQGLPNIMQLLATIAIFLMVVYFQVGGVGRHPCCFLVATSSSRSSGDGKRGIAATAAAAAAAPPAPALCT